MSSFPTAGAAQGPSSGLDRIFHGLGYRLVADEPQGVAGPSSEPDAPSARMPPLSRLAVDELGPYWLTETTWRDAAATLLTLPGGQDGGAVVPSPHAPGTAYHAGAAVHRTDDQGGTWIPIDPVGDGTVAVVAESPLEPGLLWAGTTDGRIHLSRDRGQTWVETLTGAGGRVSVLEPSPHDGARAHAAMAVAAPADAPEPAVIYRTDDHGATWHAIVPEPGGGSDLRGRVTSVREDPEVPGLLLAGTTEGIFVSFNDGARWDGLQLDLPAGPVTEIRILGRDLLVAVERRGVWVMRDVTPLRQVLDGLSRGAPHLFAPAPAFRLDEAPADGLVAGADNPMADAAIDYLLPSFVRDVRIEVLDASGAVLRAFGSDGRPVDAPSAPEEAAGQQRGARPSGTRAGVHRVVWDLRPVGGSGAAVSPGTYRVRMTVDGIVREQPLEVLPDPRVPRPPG